MRLVPTLVSLAGAALLAVPSLAAAAARDPSGTYLTQDGKARIRVEKCGAGGSHVCGYVVWLKVPLNDEGKPRVDFRNPDARKQARPSLGHQMLMGLKQNDEGHYEGKVYNAEDGKYYGVTVWSEQAGQLTVKGCLVAFLCMSQTWTQKTDIAAGQLTGPTNGASGPRADAEWAPKGTATASAASPATTGATSPKPKAAAPKAPAAAAAAE